MSQPVESVEQEVVGSSWTIIESHLLAKKKQIAAEIRNYPSPIAGCDAQFNYLLEQRNDLSRELGIIHSADTLPVDEVRTLQEFVVNSTCLSSDFKRQIMDSITA